MTSYSSLSGTSMARAGVEGLPNRHRSFGVLGIVASASIFEGRTAWGAIEPDRVVIKPKLARLE